MAQDEATRIGALVAALESDPGYATGRRAFPRTLTPSDATLIAERLSDAVDEATELRAQKAVTDGHRIACGEGCSRCCEQLVMVWLPEALRAAEYLARPENAAAREAFLAAYPSWRERMGDAPRRIAELTASNEIKQHTSELLEVWKRRIMCAFNQGGRCTIYPVRPNICRTHHALETSENCRGDTTTPPSHLAFEPLDKFVTRADRLQEAMHHALGGRKRATVALCEKVYELLTAPSRR